eukprot:814233-Pyramimonas_sp.AAC.1
MLHRSIGGGAKTVAQLLAEMEVRGRKNKPFEKRDQQELPDASRSAAQSDRKGGRVGPLRGGRGGARRKSLVTNQSSFDPIDISHYSTR